MGPQHVAALPLTPWLTFRSPFSSESGTALNPVTSKVPSRTDLQGFLKGSCYNGSAQNLPMALFIEEILTFLVCSQGPSPTSGTYFLLQAQLPSCSLSEHALTSICPYLSQYLPSACMHAFPLYLAESPLAMVQPESFTERNACCLFPVPEPLLVHHCLPSTVLRTLIIPLKPRNNQAISSKIV